MRYRLEPRYIARAPSGLATPPRHVARQVGPPLPHLRGRRPVRPLALGADVSDAAPGEADAADADAVTQGLAVARARDRGDDPAC